MNIIKNPLRTFLGLNGDKNKNIKAWRKKGSSYRKKKCNGFLLLFTISSSNFLSLSQQKRVNRAFIIIACYLLDVPRPTVFYRSCGWPMDSSSSLPTRRRLAFKINTRLRKSVYYFALQFHLFGIVFRHKFGISNQESRSKIFEGVRA